MYAPQRTEHARCSVIDLDAELYQARAENLPGPEELCPVGEVLRQDAGVVEQVVDIEHALHPGPRQRDRLGEPEIRLEDSILEFRIRRETGNRRRAVRHS